MVYLKCVATNLQWNTRVLICTLRTTFWIDKKALCNQLGETCTIWQICIYQIYNYTNVWQKHVEKRYPCIVNGTELFSHILGIKIYHVNKIIVANLIISWIFVKKIPYLPTHRINLRLLRHKQGTNLLRFINLLVLYDDYS